MMMTLLPDATISSKQQQELKSSVGCGMAYKAATID